MFFEALIFILLIMFVYMTQFRKPSNMPPGSFGLPVVGALFSVRNVMGFKHFLKKNRAEHGDIFTTKLGNSVTVYITSAALVKKAFTMPQLQERPNWRSRAIIKDGSKDYGVAMAGGERWKSNRRFILQHLRNFGMGKSYLENSIIKEIEMLTDYIETNYLDKPSEVDQCINISILNIVWLLAANTRYNADDKIMRNFTKEFQENIAIAQGPIRIVDQLPWLAAILPTGVYDKWTQQPKLLNNAHSFRRMCKDIVEEHKLNLDENDPKDIIDQYLIEGRDKVDKNYHDMSCMLTDLFVAGSDTTSGTLRWFILYMVLYPEIQQKIHDEMDNVVGNQAPTLSDRQMLPYLEATALDVMRLSSLAQLGIPHVATETVELDGYTIPKDTIVFGCLYLIHKDPRYWEKPDTLYPEHFLDAEGKLSQKNQAFLPFSTGKRSCLGESLARMEVYCFTSALLHRFRIERVPGDQLTDEGVGDQMGLNFPKPYKVIFRKRFP